NETHERRHMDNNPDSAEESFEEKDLKDIGRFPWKKLFRVFLLRIPLWLIVLLVLVIGIVGTFRYISRDEPVELKPAVTDAREVNIRITTCDDIIDERGFDIRETEKKLEERLQEKENVQEADVR